MTGSGERPALSCRTLYRLPSATSRAAARGLHAVIVTPSPILQIINPAPSLLATVHARGLHVCRGGDACAPTAWLWLDTGYNPRGLSCCSALGRIVAVACDGNSATAAGAASGPSAAARGNSGSAAAGGWVAVYDMARAQQIMLFQAHDSPCAALALSACGTRLASASEQGTVVRVWSVPSGELIQTFRRGTARARITFLSFFTLPEDLWQLDAAPAATAAHIPQGAYVQHVRMSEGEDGESVIVTAASEACDAESAPCAPRQPAAVRAAPAHAASAPRNSYAVRELRPSLLLVGADTPTVSVFALQDSAPLPDVIIEQLAGPPRHASLAQDANDSPARAYPDATVRSPAEGDAHSPPVGSSVARARVDEASAAAGMVDPAAAPALPHSTQFVGGPLNPGMDASGFYGRASALGAVSPRTDVRISSLPPPPAAAGGSIAEPMVRTFIAAAPAPGALYRFVYPTVRTHGAASSRVSKAATGVASSFKVGTAAAMAALGVVGDLPWARATLRHVASATADEDAASFPYTVSDLPDADGVRMDARVATSGDADADTDAGESPLAHGFAEVRVGASAANSEGAGRAGMRPAVHPGAVLFVVSAHLQPNVFRVLRTPVPSSDSAHEELAGSREEASASASGDRATVHRTPSADSVVSVSSSVGGARLVRTASST
ncbi:hypothetical protein EON68_01075, partial [archaeon]